jgi:hypothetical protein
MIEDWPGWRASGGVVVWAMGSAVIVLEANVLAEGTPVMAMVSRLLEVGLS